MKNKYIQILEIKYNVYFETFTAILFTKTKNNGI